MKKTKYKFKKSLWACMHDKAFMRKLTHQPAENSKDNFLGKLIGQAVVEEYAGTVEGIHYYAGRQWYVRCIPHGIWYKIPSGKLGCLVWLDCGCYLNDPVKKFK
jgi:hypothetical protein